MQCQIYKFMNCKTVDLLWHISVLQRSQEEEWFINETFTNVTHAKSRMASVYRKEWQMEALLLAEKIKEKVFLKKQALSSLSCMEGKLLTSTVIVFINRILCNKVNATKMIMEFWHLGKWRIFYPTWVSQV